MYVISVRRARILPSASFRFHLTVDTLAAQLTVPVIRVRRGLAPPSHQLTTTANRMALPHHAPCRAQSGRRRGCPRRPPTPPYERFRIRRFLICVCIINQQCLTSYKHPALPYDFRSPLPAFRPSCEASAQNVQKSGLALHIRFSPSLWWLGQLLWRLLTSVGPSMYLTMHLAQGRPTDLPG